MPKGNGRKWKGPQIESAFTQILMSTQVTRIFLSAQKFWCTRHFWPLSFITTANGVIFFCLIAAILRWDFVILGALRRHEIQRRHVLRLQRSDISRLEEEENNDGDDKKIYGTENALNLHISHLLTLQHLCQRVNYFFFFIEKLKGNSNLNRLFQILIFRHRGGTNILSRRILSIHLCARNQNKFGSHELQNSTVKEIAFRCNLSMRGLLF